mmetsp:Transcript_15514/g.44323  ORF Transcript_15514/g.44323 Transcript_15514/m.44323 type:complete len:267 (+) Transcript_15514:1338-2138(+)
MLSRSQVSRRFSVTPRVRLHADSCVLATSFASASTPCLMLAISALCASRCWRCRPRSSRMIRCAPSTTTSCRCCCSQCLSHSRSAAFTSSACCWFCTCCVERAPWTFRSFASTPSQQAASFHSVMSWRICVMETTRSSCSCASWLASALAPADRPASWKPKRSPCWCTSFLSAFAMPSSAFEVCRSELWGFQKSTSILPKRCAVEAVSGAASTSLMFLCISTSRTASSSSLSRMSARASASSAFSRARRATSMGGRRRTPGPGRLW